MLKITVVTLFSGLLGGGRFWGTYMHFNECRVSGAFAVSQQFVWWFPRLAKYCSGGVVRDSHVDNGALGDCDRSLVGGGAALNKLQAKLEKSALKRWMLRT